ncbi:MAG: hypothetical protein JNM89_07885 [Hyphomicrobiaceae bacterium]|nr:hypothetical protein [Hyphomicrobiaceae bacterium]
MTFAFAHLSSRTTPIDPKAGRRGPGKVSMALIAGAALCVSVLSTSLAMAQGTTSPGDTPPAAVAATDAANPDWPCVQHKQPVLTAAQMWDGPAIASEGQRSDDAAIRKLVKVTTSRRIEMTEISAELKQFAENIAEAERDAKLTELFAAVLAEINTQRGTILSGIERFQRRQVARAKKLEEEGIALADLQRKAEGDGALAEQVNDAQQRYDWDARVFQERQRNVPIACEIPVIVESRAFELAQAIRGLMKN